MNPLLIIRLIEAALALAPELVTDLRLLFAKGDPTPADWDELKKKVGKSYDDYMAEAKTAPPVQ